jgi:hypothetical protein
MREAARVTMIFSCRSLSTAAHHPTDDFQRIFLDFARPRRGWSLFLNWIVKKRIGPYRFNGDPLRTIGSV